jgi:hypothetical protein
MIVDTHLHIVDQGALRYPWLGGAGALNRNWLYDDYAAEARRLGIGASLHMEVDVAASDIEAETNYVSAIAARPGSMLAGDDVFALQQRLLDMGFKVGRVDGYFGPDTEAALRDFQRNLGLPPDGTCGPATLKALGRLQPRVSGGAPNEMRAQERIRKAGPRLAGKIVVIDPKPLLPELPDQLSDDPTVHARAQHIVHDVARRIEGRLVAIGVQGLRFGGAAPAGSVSTASVYRPDWLRPASMSAERGSTSGVSTTTSASEET